MITLEFTVDNEPFVEDQGMKPENIHAGILEETCFLALVRFSVDGLELLKLHGSDVLGLNLPLIGFASHLFGLVTRLKVGASEKLYLAGGGTIAFDRSGDSVTIRSSIVKDVATVGHGDLCSASKSLLHRVRDLVLQHIPEMRSHSNWAQWFSE
jgi:hypothetical protein